MGSANSDLVNQIFQTAKFVRSLGVELVGVGPGWCESSLVNSAGITQQHGFIHAGAVMTLADHTCGGAAASTVPEDKDVITIETKVSFMRPASFPKLFCRANVLRSGKSIVFVEAEVTGESNGERVLVAKASSTLSVIPRQRLETR